MQHTCRTVWSDQEVRRGDEARKADTDVKDWACFDSGGSTRGIQGTNQNFMVPANLVHIVVGPGGVMWDRRHPKITEKQHPTKSWDEDLNFLEKYRNAHGHGN